MLNYEEVDFVMAAAFGALIAIFCGAFVALLFVCRKQQKKKITWNRLNNNTEYRRSDSLRKPKKEIALALNDINLGNALDQILNDKQWVDDASGLLPHCLAILRTCHNLTERLACIAVKESVSKQSANRLIQSARRVPPRVDDVVRSMYPPLDIRLLEARTLALVLAVGQLALLTQNIFGSSTDFQWIDEGLEELDNLLCTLRKWVQNIDSNGIVNNSFEQTVLKI